MSSLHPKAPSPQAPAPISVLPVEILSEIIWFHITDDLNLPNITIFYESQLVCRLWRSVCLETSKFWSSVEVCFCRSHATHFARAIAHRRDSPLDIYVAESPDETHTDPEGPTSDERTVMENTFLSQLHHIRSILIHPIHSDFHYQLRSLVLDLLIETDINMPLLQSIQVSSPHYEGETLIWNLEHSESEECLPIIKLCLCGVYVPLELPCFRDMTHLSIKLRHPPPRPPRLQTILTVLENSPRMRTIILEDLAFRFAPDVIPIEKKIALPCLETFKLSHDDDATGTFLLRCLSVPSTASIGIDMFSLYLQDRAASADAILYPGGTLWGRVSRATRITVIVQTSWISSQVTICVQNPDDAEFKLNLSGPRCTNEQSLQVLFTILNAARRLSDFDIYAKEFDCDADGWRSLFNHSHLAQLKTLLVMCADSEGRANEFLSALTKPDGTPSLPEITRLNVYSVPAGPSVKESLEKYLRSRVAAGSPLGILQISSIGAGEIFLPLKDHVVIFRLVEHKEREDQVI